MSSAGTRQWRAEKLNNFHQEGKGDRKKARPKEEFPEPGFCCLKPQKYVLWSYTSKLPL